MHRLINALLDAPEAENPAVEMSARLTDLHHAGQLDSVKIAEFMRQIDQAAEIGERDLDAANAALGSLSRAGSVAVKEPPLGF